MIMEKEKRNDLASILFKEKKNDRGVKKYKRYV